MEKRKQKGSSFNLPEVIFDANFQDILQRLFVTLLHFFRHEYSLDKQEWFETCFKIAVRTIFLETCL